MLIKQNWSHFFFQKSVSQNKIKNNRGDIIFMIQAPLSFLCYVDERNRFDVSLQFCLVFRLFYLPFSYKNYVTLHWLQKCTVSGIQLLKHLCFFTKIVSFYCVLFHVNSRGKDRHIESTSLQCFVLTIFKNKNQD